MTDLHVIEDEQTERVRQWWQENGKSLLAGVALGIAIVGGVHFWREWRQGQAETASGYYEQMMIEYVGGKAEAAEILGARLMKDHPKTPYAGKAALYLARVSFDKGDYASARQQLRWALDNATEPATAHVARLRLARLALAQGAYDEAAGLLKVADFGGFQSEYREIEGDAHLAQGRAKAAEDAYRASLESLPKGSAYAEMLQMKLDHAAGGK